MKIGLLKEIKPTENRVLLVPSDVQLLVQDGNKVFVESNAGINAGFENVQYESAGAEIIPTSEKLFKLSEFILKVQPPMPIEIELFTKDHLSFSFLTVANIPERATSLLKRQSKFFSLELIEDSRHHHPLLRAMSKIAAHMAITQANKYLEKQFGGRGIILSEIHGLPHPIVTVLGLGDVGKEIVEKSIYNGCKVFASDTNKFVLNKVISEYHSKNLIGFEYSSKKIQTILKKTDALFSAIHQPGLKAQNILKNEDIDCMKKGTIFIDLAIDHGGSSETSRPTTHDDPVYNRDGVLHYCVPNIPSAVPKSSSEILSKTVLPYVINIAKSGFESSMRNDEFLKKGLVFYHGKVVNKTISESLEFEFYDIVELLDLNI